MAEPASAAGGPPPFIRGIRVDEAPPAGYPFDLPVVKHLAAANGLELDAAVTMPVGENGTGKSTLVEAVAVACGFNAEGGSRSFRFATTGSVQEACFC